MDALGLVRSDGRADFFQFGIRIDKKQATTLEVRLEVSPIDLAFVFGEFSWSVLSSLPSSKYFMPDEPLPAGSPDVDESGEIMPEP